MQEYGESRSATAGQRLRMAIASISTWPLAGRSATAMNVHAPTATFDGIVNCTTLKASVLVSSPMYTQGVGNFW